jgi:predicted alpha/beta superfamily hydrolase
MKRLLTFLLFLTTSGVFAQKKMEHVIDSKVFGTERKITVYLPKEYVDDTVKKLPLPVAYLFDGQFEPYFTMVSGMMDYYIQTNNGVPMILVSVHTDNRWEEFIPEPDPNNPLNYSTKLTGFLEKELFPFVNANYRTTDFKLGIGHSLGGSFLLCEAFKKNSPFGAIIAASPNTNLHGMTEMIPDYLDKNPSMTTFFYITGGDTDQMELDFLRTTLQIDSTILSRKAKTPDWNFRKYDHSNHMETFPKTFNDGYLLFSERWNITVADLILLKGLQNAALEQELKKCFARKAIVRRSEMTFSFRNVYRTQVAAELNSDFRTAFDISTLSLQVLETDSTVPQADKDDMRPYIIRRRDYYNFKDFCTKAQKAAEQKDYQTAAQEYQRAFDLNLMQGTYSERMNAVEVFALAGKTEEAFKQLELLANYFELRGSESMTGNTMLNSLHKDKRWKKYMKILDENTKIPFE